MTWTEINERVETWVIMVALENFPKSAVECWTWPQWIDFYERIEKGQGGHPKSTRRLRRRRLARS